MTPIIEVLEWQKVPIPANLDTPLMRERLMRAGTSRVGSAFRSSGSAIYAKNLVGVVDAGKLRVQLLPKISNTSTGQENAAGLLALFLRSGLKIRADVSRAHTAADKTDVLDPVIGTGSV